jgi:phospholipase/carboxylesterase
MTYRTIETPESVVLEPQQADAAVIWLHGLGADGFDFVPIVPELRLRAGLTPRFIFPHAAMRPVTINNGYTMRAWYDIVGISLSAREDDAGIRASEAVVRSIVQSQLDSGIAANRIVIAGFSQGGAIALQTVLRYPQRLGGLMALSTYLPLRTSLAAEASRVNRDVPILMCHGRNDSVVPAQLGEASRDVLKGAGYDVEWKSYPMQHEVCREEIEDIAGWLGKVL